MRRLIAVVVAVAAIVVVAGIGGTGVASSANQPLRVIEQNNPAFSPFQVELFPKTGQCQTADVPAGTRLIIEYVSARVETPQDRELVVSTTAGGVTALHWVPLSEPYVTISNAAEDVRLYADPGTEVEVCLTGLGQVTLSGHLVSVSG
ncbi:MAG TPA: hypothetical protein VFK59_05200 [Actinomycetota bacterium]|nr:hypothetical protein [Actinomycetota bacterium]